MPTGSGQYQLQDYIAELQARGFDGFTAADLTAFTNRGYFHVARKSQWYWQETTDAFSLTPGSTYVSLWPAVSGELPNFRSLDKLVITDANFTTVLKPLKDEDFFKYLGKDLTLTAYRGEPTGYYVYQNRLYVLPPPNRNPTTLLAYYHQRVSPLVSPTDVPITPQHLDEAILLAALVRCHKRANEPELANLAEADLEGFFDDMRDDEEELMGEQLDRVRPDNSWL